MSDLPVPRRYDVEPDEEVKRLWLDARIQEIRSRVARLKQDIEDLQQGQIKKLQAELRMQELTLQEYESQINAVDVTSK